MAQIHDLDQECEIQTSIFGDLLLVELWECPECPDSPMESGGELRRVASGSRRVELIISEAPLGSWSLGGPLDSFLPFPSLRPGLDFPLGDGGREPQDWIGLFNVFPASFSSRLTFFSDNRNTQERFSVSLASQGGGGWGPAIGPGPCHYRHTPWT